MILSADCNPIWCRNSTFFHNEVAKVSASLARMYMYNPHKLHCDGGTSRMSIGPFCIYDQPRSEGIWPVIHWYVNHLMLPNPTTGIESSRLKMSKQTSEPLGTASYLKLCCTVLYYSESASSHGSTTCTACDTHISKPPVMLCSPYLRSGHSANSEKSEML